MSTKLLKDRSLETYYQALFAMYGSPGWQKLMEDFERLRETHSSLAGIDNAEQLWLRKGQLDIINMVVSHHRVAEHAYAMLISEQEGDDTLASTEGVARVIE